MIESNKLPLAGGEKLFSDSTRPDIGGATNNTLEILKGILQQATRSADSSFHGALAGSPAPNFSNPSKCHDKDVLLSGVVTAATTATFTTCSTDSGSCCLYKPLTSTRSSDWSPIVVCNPPSSVVVCLYPSETQRLQLWNNTNKNRTNQTYVKQVQSITCETNIPSAMSLTLSP